MSNVSVYVETEPPNDVLKYFLVRAELTNYPKLIESVVHSTRWGQEFQVIDFFHEMDLEAKAELGNLGGIKEGEINIYLYDGRPNNIVIDEKLFDKILYDYSVKLLEVYHNSKEVPQGWAKEMEAAIKKLKQKLGTEGS